MARRTKADSIDWSAIERHYRMGQKSNLQLAAEYGVDPSGIGKRAKKHGWVQDKREEVQQTTEALLIQAASGRSDPNSTPSALEIKVAAQTNVDVILEHRTGLKRLRQLQAKLMTHLESVIDNFTDVADMIEILRTEDERGIDRVNDQMRKSMERSTVVDDLKKLSEVDERIRKGEREAFGLDSKEKQAAPFEELLLKLADQQGGQ